jgi:hypothetical protein
MLNIRGYKSDLFRKFFTLKTFLLLKKNRRALILFFKLLCSKTCLELIVKAFKTERESDIIQ